MASRRESLKKLDERLKTLVNKLPHTDEMFPTLIELGNEPAVPSANADRAAAIICAQYVDYGLRNAIEAHLNADYRKREIFDGSMALLGSLSAKIILAHALGIIDDEVRETLDTIRTIRNNFAHSAIHIEFGDREVADLCRTLKAPYLDDLSLYQPRKIYALVCSVIYFHSIVHIGSRVRNGFLEMPEP